jgi:hypothetical protein
VEKVGHALRITVWRDSAPRKAGGEAGPVWRILLRIEVGL